MDAFLEKALVIIMLIIPKRLANEILLKKANYRSSSKKDAKNVDFKRH